MKRQPLTIQALFKQMIHWPGKHFSLAELVYSRDAEQANLPNLPSMNELSLLARLTTEVLDPIRVLWDGPIYVNSGFRDPAVNDLAGGVEHSDHLAQMGAAADIRPAVATEMAVRGLYKVIAKSSVQFDQLILYDGRMHIGWRPLGNRKELRIRVGDKEPMMMKSMLENFPNMNGADHEP